MHYIYILGLEHSGTTLSEDLLSRAVNAVGTGEAANFFSSAHMKEYIRRWDSYEDARICSCGAKWDECRFWGPIVATKDYESKSFTEKYRLLCRQALKEKGETVILIDSSKSMQALEKVIAAKETLGLAEAKLCIVMNIKDVRGFAQSMVKKNSGTMGLVAILRSFNLWLGVNQQYLDKLSKMDCVYRINRYEELCAHPYQHISAIYRHFGVNIGAEEVKVNSSNAHIAIGNKDYVMRNRSTIKYDGAWRSNWRIKLAYLIHSRARKANKEFMKQV